MFTLLHFAELCFVGSALLVSVAGVWMLKQHLRSVPLIETEDHLRAFAAVARFQMYLALWFLVCAVVAIACILMDRSDLDAQGLFLMWLPYGSMWIFSFLTRRVEKRVRDEARCAEPLRENFGDICYVWSKKMLPNF